MFAATIKDVDILGEDHECHNIAASNFFAHAEILQQEDPNGKNETADDESGNENFTEKLTVKNRLFWFTRFFFQDT